MKNLNDILKEKLNNSKHPDYSYGIQTCIDILSNFQLETLTELYDLCIKNNEFKTGAEISKKIYELKYGTF